MNSLYFVLSLFILQLNGSPLDTNQNSSSLNRRLFNPFKLFSKLFKGKPTLKDVQINYNPGFNPQNYGSPIDILSQSRGVENRDLNNGLQATQDSKFNKLLTALQSLPNPEDAPPEFNYNYQHNNSPDSVQITVNGKRIDPNKLPSEYLFDVYGNANPYAINSLINSSY